jgi:ubiquinone/menaquinone biosynthesis C-methylase UbiE
MENILKSTAQDDLKHLRAYYDFLISKEDLENKVVLDIGCGYGAFVLYASEKKVKKVYGIEITEKDLATAKKCVEKENVELKVGSGIEIPFPDNYFDTVVSFEVLEHIPKNTENKMFSEINRVLKKGGKLYLSTPFDSFFSKLFDPAFYLIGHRHYSLKQIKEFTKNNNLKILSTKVWGGIWQILAQFDLYISKWIFRRHRFFEEYANQKNIKELKENVEGYMDIYLIAKKI